MSDRKREGREEIARELAERAEEQRQSRRAPTADEAQRRLETGPGVEWHAGEDAGEVPDADDDGRGATSK